MINFQPGNCLPRDSSGFGQWRNGHYLEHVVLRQKCAALSTPVSVPDYDILSWDDDPKAVQQWLVAHEAIHEAIRQATNVDGVDLSLVDFSQDDEFFIWMDTHEQEHIAERNILGVV